MFGRALQQRRDEDARQNRIDADTVVHQVARNRQGHADDGGLGCGIGRLADLTIFCGDRRGADNRAALAIIERR